MTNPVSPLDATHLSQIVNGLQLLDQAEAQVVLAKQAGIDVSRQEKDILEHRNKLLALKRTYFPNG